MPTVQTKTRAELAAEAKTEAKLTKAKQVLVTVQEAIVEIQGLATRETNDLVVVMKRELTEIVQSSDSYTKAAALLWNEDVALDAEFSVLT